MGATTCSKTVRLESSALNILVKAESLFQGRESFWDGGGVNAIVAFFPGLDSCVRVISGACDSEGNAGRQRVKTLMEGISRISCFLTSVWQYYGQPESYSWLARAMKPVLMESSRLYGPLTGSFVAGQGSGSTYTPVLCAPNNRLGERKMKDSRDADEGY